VPVKPKQKVNENSSCKLEFQLVDWDGVTGIPNTSIDQCLFTLKDQLSGTVINSNSATALAPLTVFDVSGNFSYVLSSADNAIQNEDRWLDNDYEEVHVATFDITATSGSDTVYLTEEIWVIVINLKYSG